MDITCDNDSSDKREEYEGRSKIQSFNVVYLHNVYSINIENAQMKTLNNTYLDKKISGEEPFNKYDSHHVELQSIQIYLFLEMDSTFQTKDPYHNEIIAFFS